MCHMKQYGALSSQMSTCSTILREIKQCQHKTLTCESTLRFINPYMDIWSHTAEFEPYFNINPYANVLNNIFCIMKLFFEIVNHMSS